MSITDPNYLRALREQAETREQLAYVRGQLDSTIEALARDPEHVELLRALAWARTGLVFGMQDGKPTSVPSGWPEGIDGGMFVAEWVKEQIAKCQPPAAGSPAATASASVRHFREQLDRRPRS